MIEHAVIPGANHFFENCVEPLIEEVGIYLDRRLGNPPKLPTPTRSDPRRAGVNDKADAIGHSRIAVRIKVAAIKPPGNGASTPVVVGKVIGKFFSRRTAR